jgi:hypothetical protein
MSRTDLSELIWQRSSKSAVSTRERVGLGVTTDEPSIIDSRTNTATIASTWKTVAEAPVPRWSGQ